jgi:protein-tyrosine-phosphatase
MAEGFARASGPPDLIVYSAGSHPAGFVAREAIESMKEKGIDLSAHHSKGLRDVPLMEYDYVVTMGCGDACPWVPAKKRLDWKIPDPIGRGADFFRSVRDDLEIKVRNLLKSC